MVDMKLVVAALTAVTLVSSSCIRADAQSAHAATTPSTPSTTTPSTPPAVVPAGPLGVVLTEFERLHQDLARDSAANLAAIVGRLTPASDALTAAGHPQAAAIAAGVTALSAALPAAGATADLKVVRVAFGELSRGIVGAIAADPTLQVGRFLYQCPMAKGYQRWVELKPRMENPYMGSRMLECGSAVVAWTVDG